MIKRLVAVLLTVLMLAVVVPFSAASAEGNSFTVTVTADKTQVSCGNTITFIVLVNNINVEGGLLSVDVPFRFDSKVFELVGKTAVYPDEWAAPKDFSYVTDKNGLLWLRSLNDEGVFNFNGCDTDNAIGFRVLLRAKQNATIGNTTVTINGDGVFEVISGTAADGNCTEVGGTGAPLTVNVAPFDKLMGDVNGDEYVDNLDAATVLKYDAGIVDLNAEKVEIGDMNGDGTLDNLDATMILKIDAGLA